MSVIRPFKAIRPDKKYAESVAALPYDVMSSDEARKMVSDNPYSFLHVDKSEVDLPINTDLYSDEVYAKAKDNLYEMIEKGILISDSSAHFYLYQQTMDGRKQTGLVACASIDEYINGKIKKHELTREDKEQDRIKHVTATNSNTGPIFLTYRSKNEINNFINEYIQKNMPVYNFVSDDGIGHTVWVAEGYSDEITELFAGVDCLYIADGHHRNASAVKVGLQKRKENPDYTGEEEFNFYLAVLFPHDELYIMDYNRLIKKIPCGTEDFFAQIKVNFDVTEIGSTPYKPDSIHTFGMYIDKKWHKLTAKEHTINKDDAVAALDVSILQDYILTPILNIGDVRIDKGIDFAGGMRGLNYLSDRVDSGEMAVAFSMFPTSMTELMSVADADKIMPPKSTWFEPKLRSGLFVHKLS